ncbi:hypothetical protein chiPu_0026054 [Chiloscyllium punctatum]|uniref:Uncharacterized protein n=1 Tax=Chiloscyllium punctatum TaxID=137246 RepID=A0A401THH3_CHIPU|nr:hypothetical protein [Chiloscyllium punctatum]
MSPGSPRYYQQTGNERAVIKEEEKQKFLSNTGRKLQIELIVRRKQYPLEELNQRADQDHQNRLTLKQDAWLSDEQH